MSKAAPKRVTVEIEGEGEEATRPAVAPGGYAAPADTVRLAPIFADLAESDALRTLRVTRTMPKDPPFGGFIRDYPPDLTIESIRQYAGGGTYEIVAFDSAGRKRLTEIVRIGGRPKVPVAEGEEDRTAPAGGGSMAELRAFMSEMASGQRAATESLISSMRAQSDAREREIATASAAQRTQFQEFFLLVKEENKTTIQTVVTAVTESGKASMAAVAESSKTTVAAAMSLANGAIELAKSDRGKEGGGSGTDLKEMLAFAKEINASPWEKLLPVLLVTMMGGGKEGGGGSIPPEALAMLMGQEMKALPDKLGPAGGAANSARTPERVGDAAEREEDLGEHPAEEDPIGDFLQWIASTPDEVLGLAIAARLRTKTVPEAVAAAIQAGINGDNVPIVTILTEYESLDLVPRIQRVAEQFRAAAEQARAAK